MIEGGLRPLPPFDVKVLRRDEGRRWAAVVKVDEVDEPPCMRSTDGAVFLRLSGITVPVREPLMLARLLERGQAARARAEESAAAVVSEQSSNYPVGSITDRYVALGLASTASAASGGRRLFEARFESEFKKAVGVHLRPSRGADHDAWGVLLEHRQHRLSGVVATHHHATAELRWAVWANSAGSVGVFCSPSREWVGGVDLLFEDIIVPAWRVGARLVRALAGRADAAGDAYVCIQIRAPHPFGDLLLPGTTRLTRWTDAADSAEDEVGGLRRELLRAAGQRVHEPPAS
jgi:hypothetical protein